MRDAIEARGASVVVVDSLNAYLQSMPDERHLMLQMHEMLSYLNQQGAITLLILATTACLGHAVGRRPQLSQRQHRPVSLFEARAKSAPPYPSSKSRTQAHERTIREMRLSTGGMQVGAALRDFEGVLTGLPSYKGAIDMLPAAAEQRAAD